MRSFLKAALKKTPRPLPDLARALYERLPPGLRYGKEYRDFLKVLGESEFWDLPALRAYQERGLEQLIHHSYAHVPYYRHLFDRLGLKPGDIQSAEDLAKLPLLTKDIVRRCSQDLLADNSSFLDREPAHTAGTTGSPLQFAISGTLRATERAATMRHLLWLGYRPHDRIVRFRVFPPRNPHQPYQYSVNRHELVISFYDTHVSHFSEIVDLVHNFRPDFISAAPSTLYVLARWMELNKKQMWPARFLLTGSENVYPHVRARIETQFRSKVVDYYGQEEQVAVAMQCSHRFGYHIQTEVGVVELLPAIDGLYEIVGTSLHNFSMPFIRYRTGDLAASYGGECPCGRRHPVISNIHGRTTDFLVNSRRSLISPLRLNYVFSRMREIREAQIIQEDYDRIRVKVIPWDKLGERSRHSIKKSIAFHLNDDSIHVSVEEVDDIPRTRRGKRPFVMSAIRFDDDA